MSYKSDIEIAQECKSFIPDGDYIKKVFPF